MVQSLIADFGFVHSVFTGLVSFMGYAIFYPHAPDTYLDVFTM